MEDIVQMFKALGDETRLKILLILSQRNICAKGISRHLNISEAAVSQHIKVLKDARIIIGEKVGYYVLYHLQEPILVELVNFINNISHNEVLINEQYDFIPCDCKDICKKQKNKCCHKK